LTIFAEERPAINASGHLILQSIILAFQSREMMVTEGKPLYAPKPDIPATAAGDSCSRF
jgi:hypothetical protein